MPRPALARVALCALAVLSILVSNPALAAEGSIRPSGRPEIVIYNDDTALVREVQTLQLAKGVGQVTLEGVPQRIDSTSVRLQGAGFRVLKQVYRYDLWNGDRVFRRFLGDTISYRFGGKVYRGLLAGIEGDDLFIQRRDSAEVLTMLKRGQISEVEFPARLRFRTRPTLLWEIDSERGGEQKGSLSYLTSGIGWSAEYAAVLDAKETSVELSGWATVLNRTGRAFLNAGVSLVAGDVHREGESLDRGSAFEGSPGAPVSKPAEFFAYHIYPLAGTMDLDQSETVQVSILPPTRVDAARTYRYDGARDGSKVRVQVECGGDGEGLGVPLPEGRVRVYAADASGSPTLVGEDRIPHTASGERVKIQSGVAFDLIGERSRVSHTRVSRNVTEDEYRIRIRNHGSKKATVTVTESLYGNWEIFRKSVDARKIDADSAEFDLSVPAGKEAVLTYAVRYTF